MGIGAVGISDSLYNVCANTSNEKVEPNFESYRKNDTSTKDVLSYYEDLCKEFKGISFRLDDIQEASKHGNCPYLGYNNSFNQVGVNFGNMGQCSITLDVSVIERMQKDPQYEERVKGMIQNSYDRYSEYTSRALEDGYSYMSLVIEDNNGMPTRSIQQSNSDYSTEDEVRKMWNMDSDTKKISLQFEEQKKALIDSYLKMLDENSKVRNKLYGKN